jgi:hypothetical protein
MLKANNFIDGKYICGRCQKILNVENEYPSRLSGEGLEKGEK